MRLWSLHPAHLDARGLVALWREALLAQKVLRGETRGYRHHPQLLRFKAHPTPLAAIADYLREVQREAARRGYQFDISRIGQESTHDRIAVTRGQIAYEWQHLCNKLKVRDPVMLTRLQKVDHPMLHPLFYAVEGGVESWEIV